MAFEERSETKHEYYAGDFYAMAGASPAHKRICFNPGGLLFTLLRGSACIGYTSDQKIWIESTQLNAYADVTIVCGQAQYNPEHPILLANLR